MATAKYAKHAEVGIAAVPTTILWIIQRLAKLFALVLALLLRPRSPAFGYDDKDNKVAVSLRRVFRDYSKA